MTETTRPVYNGVVFRNEYFVWNDVAVNAYGNNGNDYMSEATGNDPNTIGYNDFLEGQSGWDIIFGQYGNDTIYGDFASDGVNGTEAGFNPDQLLGGFGNDVIFGQNGADYVNGEAGEDLIFGGIGDDFLQGGSGADTVYGGSGNDTLIGGSLNIFVPQSYKFSISVQWDGISGGSYSTEFTFTPGEAADNDVSDDYLDGGAGNDTIYGLAGTDTMFGGAGNDYLDGGNDGDFLDGGYGDDTLRGQLGGDQIYGGDGNDTLGGVDGTNSDYLNGGVGNDIYEQSADTDSIFDEAGTDTILSTISRSLAGYATIENLTLQGSGNLNGSGNDLANRLIGNSGNNVLNGGAGTDFLEGKLGIDHYYGGSGSDMFMFRNVADSGVGANRDVIYDFDDSGNDRIVLSSIAGLGTYIGSASFSGEGQVRAIASGANVLIEINTTGINNTPEMQIMLIATTMSMIGADDFVL